MTSPGQRTPSRFVPSGVGGAVLWMTGALASFMAMALAGRELASELGTFGILFFRSIIGFAVVAVLLQRAGWRHVRTERLTGHLLRNMAHLGGQYGWFLGIALIPLAEVFAIEFTTPIWTAILAALFLGERLTLLRLVAIALGFAGVLVILRPGIEIIDLGAVAVLGAALGYAVAYVSTKSLARTEMPLTILFYMTVLQLPLTFVAALSEWHWPSAAMWPWLVVVGVAGLTAHYCLTQALKLADATIVVPLDFLRLPLIAVIGYFAYAEPLDPFTLLGAALVLAANYINTTTGTRRR